MAYLSIEERDRRLANVRALMEKRGLDIVLVYYDEFNIGNGWYLTGWCPQFESGAVLIPRTGAPMLLGGASARDPLEGVGAGTIADATRAISVSHEQVGDDILVRARLREW